MVVTEESREHVRASRRHVERVAEDICPNYGDTTELGALATIRISPKKRLGLRHSLLCSHAARLGAFVESEVVRAIYRSGRRRP